MKAIRVKNEMDRAGVYYVRCEAMVIGFGVSLEREFADDNSDYLYILVLTDDGKPLNTNRIHLFQNEGFAKIERVATVQNARGTGAGRAGIEAAEDWIKELGIKKVIITSREEAVGFYEKLGYTLREDMDPDTLQPKKEGAVTEAFDPRFVCVYMDKILD